MNKTVYIIITGLLTLLSGCAVREAFQEPELPEFTADLGHGISAKAYISSGESSWPVLWEKGDRIAVFGITGQNAGSIYSTGDGGSTSARFRFDDSFPANRPLELSDFYTAVYPATAECLDGTVTFTIPERQTYRSGNVGKEAWPMVGTSSGHSISFSGLCGLLKLHLTAPPGCRINEIRVGALQDIGLVRGLWSQEKGARWEIPENKADTIGRITTLDCSTVTPEPGEEGLDFFIVLPPARYLDMAFQAGTCDGGVYIYSIPGITEIGRNMMHGFNLGLEDFLKVSGSYLETGKKSFRITGLEYAVEAETRLTDDGTLIYLKSCRTASLRGEQRIVEPAAWHAMFSTDGGMTFSASVPAFLHGLETSGKGSSSWENPGCVTCDSTCIVKFVQDRSGKSASLKFGDGQKMKGS